MEGKSEAGRPEGLAHSRCCDQTVLGCWIRGGAGTGRENEYRMELQISGCQEEHGDNGAEERDSNFS